MKTIRRICKIICFPLIVIGAVLCLLGYYDYFVSLSGEPKHELLALPMVGIPLISFGIITMVVAFTHSYTHKITMRTLIDKEREESDSCTVRCRDASQCDKCHTTCRSCKKTIDADSVFCKHCGTKIITD